MRGAAPVVLKVARAEGEEWRAGEVLSLLAGHGVVPVLEREPGAVLMPRLSPGHDLSQLSASGRDDEATEILANSIARLESVALPAGADFPRVEALATGFERYRDRARGLFPEAVVDLAQQTFVGLCTSQRSMRLLHSDLHHYNVLFDDVHGWTVIDPQGLVGEPEFELGASLRNPIDALALLGNPDLLVRRIDIFQRRLGIDPDRVLRWAFAEAVLAALWPTEEGVGVDLAVPFSAVVRVTMQLLGHRQAEPEG